MTNIRKDCLLDELNWNLSAGADEVIAEDPCDYFAVSTAKAAKEALLPTSAPAPAAFTAATPAAPATAVAAPATAATAAASDLKTISTLAELKEEMLSFKGCGLKTTATNTVFADGVPTAPVMIIGEAPGADEDRIGLPFVGKSGMLLDKMLESIGLSRARNVYISNILPWRPPGNRAPTPAEVVACLPFIKRHIELVAPKILVFLGASAASALLGVTESVSRIRGKWFKYEGTPALVTFHPAYLLRTPLQKKSGWQDMLALEEKLAEETAKETKEEM